VLYGIVRDEHDSRDLAQEGFLKAWRSIRQFEGRSSFYTWLYKVTVNLAIDALRQGVRFAGEELGPTIPSSLPSPRAIYQRNEFRQHLNAALAKLSPEHTRCHRPKGDRESAISRDRRNAEYPSRYSHVAAFLWQKKATIDFRAYLQQTLPDSTFIASTIRLIQKLSPSTGIHPCPS
jgi:Sigma-70 region 2